MNAFFALADTQISAPAKTRARAAEKQLSRQRALQIFPGSYSLFARKRDHGRAQAALIASTPITGFPSARKSTAGGADLLQPDM
jgi:hypothetical protein